MFARGLVAVGTSVVVGASLLVVGCGNLDAQNKACARAVDALSADLASIRRASGISDAAVTSVEYSCPDRTVWRTFAAGDDIATQLGALSGVNDPSMKGTSDAALSRALSYLCANYGHGGTALCTTTT